MSQTSTATKPRNLSHLAIGVSDMEASLRFYCDIIGLAVAVDQIEDFERPTPIKRRGVYLRWAYGDDDAFIVLDQTLSDPKPTGKPKPLFDVGLHHYGFWVDDVDVILERARAAGYPVALEPQNADSGAWGEAPGRGIRVGLLKDPDGNVVQLDQRF